MALFPAQCQVLEVPKLWVPIVVCENVYVLPGVPQLFTAMVKALPSRLGQHGVIHRLLLYTPLVEGTKHGRCARRKAGRGVRGARRKAGCAKEGGVQWAPRLIRLVDFLLTVLPRLLPLVHIADELERAARQYTSVSIGSYPRFGDQRCPVMVSIEVCVRFGQARPVLGSAH